MQHEQLWAPWRMAYVSRAATEQAVTHYRYDFLPGADTECFICRALAARNADDSLADRQHFVAYRGTNCVVILNRFPYNNGHLLVAPLAHQGRLHEIAHEVAHEMQQVIARFVDKLERLMNAQGFNIGLNLGHVAGAGVPGHLHWHVVPRWSGDTNFMGAIAGVEVIPQALDALWELLHE